MSLQEAIRYEQISPKAYEHPADRAATAALRSIPLMDKAVKCLSDFGHESAWSAVLWVMRCRFRTDRYRCYGPGMSTPLRSSTSPAYPSCS